MLSIDNEQAGKEETVITVGFEHRSLKEFLIARRIVRMLYQNRDEAKAMLAHKEITEATMHFAGRLLAKLDGWKTENLPKIH